MPWSQGLLKSHPYSAQLNCIKTGLLQCHLPKVQPSNESCRRTLVGTKDMVEDLQHPWTEQVVDLITHSLVYFFLNWVLIRSKELRKPRGHSPYLWDSQENGNKCLLMESNSGHKAGANYPREYWRGALGSLPENTGHLWEWLSDVRHILTGWEDQGFKAMSSPHTMKRWACQRELLSFTSRHQCTFQSLHLPMPQATTPENAWLTFVVYRIIRGSCIHPVGEEEWILSYGSEGESRQIPTFYREGQRGLENSVPGQDLKGTLVAWLPQSHAQLAVCQ